VNQRIAFDFFSSQPY